MPSTSRTAIFAVLTAAVAALTACSGSSSPAPAGTGTPTPTATSLSPEPVAVATCPLTGQPPKGAQKVRRVALAVKIDNVTEARPQAGIDKADIVVEETVEGGLTRLMAIFQCDAAPNVGPIRSARTSDGDLLRLLNGAVFGYSGANPKAIAPVAATSGAELISYDANAQYYHRDGSRPAPHNVFSSTETILKAGLARNHKLHAPRPVFSYGELTNRGRKSRHVAVTWPAASAAWDWNGKTWLRTQGGSADTVTSGARVAAANVVIMSITTRDTGLHDVLGNPSPDDVVTGSGTVWVFRDGRVIKGTWHRANRAAKMTLQDNKGKLIPLHAGRTWVELLPRPRTPTLS
jgi:hypothetical protein